MSSVPPIPRSDLPPPPRLDPTPTSIPIAAASPSLADGDGATLDQNRAIEVTAMLGDSVVEVKHLSDPRGGKISLPTYLLLGLGAAALIASIVAFTAGVENAALNRSAARYHTEELGLPMHEFRPHRIGLVYDWMAFGGAATALGCLALALVRIRRERERPGFHIGCARDVDFAADAPLGAPSFPLVAPLGDDFVLNFVDGMAGEVYADGQLTPLAALRDRGLARPSTSTPGALEMAIPRRARVRVNSGTTTYLVSSVARPRRQATPILHGLSTTMIAFVAGSAVAHLGLWALLRTIPPDPKTLALDAGGGEGRFTHFSHRAAEEPIPDQQEQLADGSDANQPGGTGKQMALEPGKMGNPDSDRVAGRYKLENRGGDPRLARARAVDSARNAGIAGILRSGDLFASLTGTGDFASGLDERTVYGGMVGDEVGEMHGGFGYGAHGFGPGAGGNYWNTIGAGHYGTLGWGDGTGTGYDVGSGDGGPAKRKSKLPIAHIGNAVTSPGMDKNIIRRYIRRKLPRIKYCYEKQLLARPGLEGTVVSNFQISPNGAVLGARASGLADEVSSCIADVISTIQFPRPSGLVQVRYPFNFRPAGS